MLRKMSFAIVGALLVSGVAAAAQSEFDHMSGDTGPVVGARVRAAAAPIGASTPAVAQGAADD